MPDGGALDAGGRTGTGIGAAWTRGVLTEVFGGAMVFIVVARIRGGAVRGCCCSDVFHMFAELCDDP